MIAKRRIARLTQMVSPSPSSGVTVIGPYTFLTTVFLVALLLVAKVQMVDSGFETIITFIIGAIWGGALGASAAERH